MSLYISALLFVTYKYTVNNLGLGEKAACKDKNTTKKILRIESLKIFHVLNIKNYR